MKNWNTFDSKERQIFQKISRRLIGEQFILKKNSPDDFEFFFRYFDVFKGAFAKFGYDLIIKYDVGYGCIAVDEELPSSNNYRLSQPQTWLLLALSSLYREKQSIAYNFTVAIKAIDVFEHIKIAIGKDLITAKHPYTKMSELLNVFKTHKIIDYTTSDFNATSLIKIYPSIEELLDINKMREIKEKYKEAILDFADISVEDNLDIEGKLI